MSVDHAYTGITCLLACLIVVVLVNALIESEIESGSDNRFSILAGSIVAFGLAMLGVIELIGYFLGVP